jgi:hypothetical protein
MLPMVEDLRHKFHKKRKWSKERDSSHPHRPDRDDTDKEHTRILSFIQDSASGNILRQNIAIGNKIDLVDFAEVDELGEECESNEWIDNTFDTRRPDCIE